MQVACGSFVRVRVVPHTRAAPLASPSTSLRFARRLAVCSTSDLDALNGFRVSCAKASVACAAVVLSAAAASRHRRPRLIVGASGIRSAPGIRRSGARSYATAACSTGTLQDLAGRCDNSLLRELREDPEGAANAPNRRSRQVRSGHYVLVEPIPLQEPYVVALSPEMAMTEFGLSQEAIDSEHFKRLFSGDMSLLLEASKSETFQHAWATPYALSIYGQEMLQNCPFGNGNGYGDGRAISIGEVVSTKGTRWELQLKGAGPTPFCRGADGRAVLRSSAREFLVSEAMHHLGIPTTRAVSLVASRTDFVARPWYSHVSDSSDAALDVSLRRILKDQRSIDFDELPESVKAGFRQQLMQELEMQRASKNPNIMREEQCAITCRASPSFLRAGQVELFARRARDGGAPELQELSSLLEHVLNREFPDVLPDEPLPQRALSMLRSSGMRLATLSAEWIRVGYVQGNFNSDNCLIGGRTMDYGPFGFVERYEPFWNMWIGGQEKYGFLNQPAAAFKNFESLVEAVKPVLDSEQLREADKIIEDFPSWVSAALGEVWRRKLGFLVWSENESALFKDLEPLLRAAGADYTIFWRKLADVAERGVINVNVDDASLLEPLQLCFYTVPSQEERAKWGTWIRRWLRLLQSSGALETAAVTMRRASPKYVPREWMLVDAYNAAIAGNHEPLQELAAVFRQPYEELPDFEERFFRRMPVEVEGRGGTAWMS